jgi:hypothetical protein
VAPLSSRIRLQLAVALCGSYNPGWAETHPVWANPRSLATTWGVTVVFLSSRYLDVSVPWVGSHSLCIQLRVTGLQPAGFSHSEICGSKVICTSPQLIAAYHVLHRLTVPRHPPCALTYLTPYRASAQDRRALAFGCSALCAHEILALAVSVTNLPPAARGLPAKSQFQTDFDDSHHVKERSGARGARMGPCGPGVSKDPEWS